MQVDTEACEQAFFWFSRYGKMTRKMNRHTCFSSSTYVNSIINVSYWNWRQDHFFEAIVCFVHCTCSIWMLSKFKQVDTMGF